MRAAYPAAQAVLITVSRDIRIQTSSLAWVVVSAYCNQHARLSLSCFFKAESAATNPVSKGRNSAVLRAPFTFISHLRRSMHKES